MGGPRCQRCRQGRTRWPPSPAVAGGALAGLCVCACGPALFRANVAGVGDKPPAVAAGAAPSASIRFDGGRRRPPGLGSRAPSSLAMPCASHELIGCDSVLGGHRPIGESRSRSSGAHRLGGRARFPSRAAAGRGGWPRSVGRTGLALLSHHGSQRHFRAERMTQHAARGAWRVVSSCPSREPQREGALGDRMLSCSCWEGVSARGLRAPTCLLGRALLARAGVWCRPRQRSGTSRCARTLLAASSQRI